MPSISSLANKLQRDYPEFIIEASDDFRWSPEKKTVYYDRTSIDMATLLHELSHAILGHQTYTRDIQLIELERDAWNYALSTLAPLYSVAIQDSVVQDSLDTYRDWLHSRSTCPVCKATGIQATYDTYKCLACMARWRVNEARSCGLKRYRL